jgi:hypothetical protein
MNPIAIGVRDAKFIPFTRPQELEKYIGILDKILVKRSAFTQEELKHFVIPSVKRVAGSILCID